MDFNRMRFTTRIVFILSSLFAFVSVVQAQNIPLGFGGQNITTCSGTILDPGGNGNYDNDLNVTQTFTSANPGECIQLTINSFATEPGFDFLRIYNGNSIAGELLFEQSGTNVTTPVVITSTQSSGGSITINFTTDGSSVDEGFSIDIACVPCPPDPIVYTLGQGGSTITGCGAAILRDPGATDNYPNGSNAVQTFCSGTGECIRLSFLEFELELGLDFVRFYDGNSTSAPLIDSITGFNIPPAIQCSDQSGGCLTVQFISNAINSYSGFKANLECVPCGPPQLVYVLGQNNGTINTCGGIIRDPGGLGDYPNNQNVVQTFCSSSGSCIQIDFDQLQTENSVDVIRLYDGPSTSSALLNVVSGIIIPPAITTSTNSEGCLTVEFISNGFISSVGFSATLTCVPCSPPPDIFILGQGEATLTTCDVMIQDPGGAGQYSNNLNVTQTICSGNNQCVQLTFTEFATEDSFDRLIVYDGPDSSAELLGVFSGFNLPAPISSSTASGGCLTLVFTTSSSATNIGFQAQVSCVTCPNPVDGPTGSCYDADPFCSGLVGGITFPAGQFTTSEFEGGVCCLGSTPNPAWYFMRVDQPGSIDIEISSGFDVDFMCWGPFTEEQWQNGVCAEVLDPNQDCISGTGAYYVDCSFSVSAFENCNIPNAQSGEYYLLLITNYSNQLTNINFQQTGGSGSTDCSVLCEMDVTANPSACDPATNTFTVSGDIQLINAPQTGTLTIANSLGGLIQYSAPFGETVNYNFMNVASNGAQGEISVVFSDNNLCEYIQSYTAPQSCNDCPIVAGTIGAACIGQTIALSATPIQDATYSWTGPNGFTSTEQNPVLTNVDQTMQGVYSVTANVAGNNCQSIATTNVFVFPTPNAPVLGINSPVCEGVSINLTANSVASATFNWSGPNAFFSNDQNPVIEASLINSGIYVCWVEVDGCASPLSLIEVIVNPSPVVSFELPFSEWCVMESLTLSGGNPAGGAYSGNAVNNQVFSPTSAGDYTLSYTVTNDFGCSSSDVVVLSVDFCNGIHSESVEYFQLIPNPATEELNVYFRQPEKAYQLLLYDLTGKVTRIGYERISDTQGKIPIHNLNSGVYQLVIQTPDKIFSGRFLKVN